MYRIKVIAEISPNIYEVGYFTKCYRATVCDEVGTYIAYSNGNDINADQIKEFKTLSEAKRKVEFLQEKIDQNGYLWRWELEIVKIE